MALPTFHSCTWSDDDAGTSSEPTDQGFHQQGPESLQDKELYVWVTYPDRKRPKGRKKRPGKRRSPRKDVSLWAVVIIEELHRLDDFTFEVTLRKVFKHEEDIIRVWVRNDPRDQSYDAEVFGFVSPPPHQLTSLEHQLVHIAGKRVYDAIADAWQDAAVRSAT
jgi:hypothetical protein